MSLAVTHEGRQMENSNHKEAAKSQLVKLRLEVRSESTKAPLNPKSKSEDLMSISLAMKAQLTSQTTSSAGPNGHIHLHYPEALRIGFHGSHGLKDTRSL